MTGTTSYDVQLDPSWCIGTKPHGGYLLSVAAEKALDEAHPHPLAVSAHYLAAPDAGAALLEVERLRTGRRVASTRVRLSQLDRTCLEVLVTAGTLTAGPAFWTGPARPPSLPPVQECVRAPSTRPDGARYGPLDHVDVHMGPDDVPGENSGWLGMANGEPTAPLDLLIFADTLPPVTFALGLPGWVPTVELTVLLRQLPVPGWVRGVQRSQLLHEGWIDEECDLWDADGRLVAQSRQLAGYRVPD